MVTILHRELEHKVEKVKHIKLEVMRPNITDQSTLIVNCFVKNKDWGRGRGGLIERGGGGGLNRGFTVM